jgi:hypothetical protein
LERAPVKGFPQNVFFLDHEHGEGGSADDVSRHNAYEVRWPNRASSLGSNR